MAVIRNRVVEHITCKASELVPHPLNFRTHPANQQRALAESYEEIGFARSLLGWRMPDGKIQLIDGHLRASHDPDMSVVVEVLDVTEEEARKLLLTVDPIGALAETDHAIHDKLREMTSTDSEALAGLWQATADDYRSLKNLNKQPKGQDAPTEQHLVIVTCRNESEQVTLLRRFRTEGLECKAVIS